MQLKVWDARTGKALWTLKTPKGYAESLTSSHLVLSSKHEGKSRVIPITAFSQPMPKRWLARKWALTLVYRSAKRVASGGISNWSEEFASPNDRELVTVDRNFQILRLGVDDKTVSAVKLRDSQGKEFRGWKFGFSEDASLVAVYVLDASIGFVIDTKTGVPVSTIDFKGIVPGHLTGRFTSDNKYLLLQYEQLIWAAKVAESGEVVPIPWANSIKAITTLADGSFREFDWKKDSINIWKWEDLLELDELPEPVR